MWILGINAPPAGWHDTAACLIDERGEIVAFCEEERLNRRRHSMYRRPEKAARLCLEMAGIGAGDLDVIAIGWDYTQLYPDLADRDVDVLAAALGLDFGDRYPQIRRIPHHLAHATSAFHASPFSSAAVLVVDGHGENESTSMWTFGNEQEPQLERSWPRTTSLGYAYDAASTWLGFGFLNAGKTMGLAAYGRADALRAESMVTVDADDLRVDVPPPAGSGSSATAGAIRRDYDAMVGAWRERYTAIAGADRPKVSADRLHQDPNAVLVAWTAQRMIEDALCGLAAMSRRLSGVPQLCLAGGVALNCSTNGMLAPPLYVPPVPHDAGVALGAAWAVCPPVSRTGSLSPYLGRPLRGRGAGVDRADVEGLVEQELDIDVVVELLLAGQVGAVAEGRAEIGPRALCHRSIIALPDRPEVTDTVNGIKGREPWRPLAGAATADHAPRFWSGQEHLSRYMLGAAQVTEVGRRAAPAVVHVDGTTRPQVVDAGEAPVAGAILHGLQARGVEPLLLNTSFNGPGEPVVDSAADAVAAFRDLRLDFLLLGGQLYRKRT